MATGKWPAIPDDAIHWVRSVFAEANRKATERLINVPNIRETSLDDGLIEAITPLSAPRLLPSGAVVELQVHNIGGLRRVGRWETADIAILVFVYDQNKLVAQKIGLLQSKRLYPLNGDVDDSDPLGFAYGLNAFLHRQPGSPLGVLRRKFEFDEASVYGALHAGDKQVEVIDDFNKQFGEAIYYLFYNPPDLPTTMYIRYALTAHTPDELIEAYALAARHLDAAPECVDHELAQCTEEQTSLGHIPINRIHKSVEL